MGRRLIAANWKMHGNREFTRRLLADLTAELTRPGACLDNGVEVAIMPPSLLLADCRRGLEKSSLALHGLTLFLGVQNLARWSEGAYTGEISAAMAADQGCRFAIIGHSERRQLMGEDDQAISEKVAQCLASGLKPILCVGETLQEREDGQAFSRVTAQLQQALTQVNPDQWQQVVIAYEPVWAIGTGVSASAEDAQAVHRHIRVTLAALGAPAQEMAVIYGGSVKPETAKQLFAQPDIDGGLIGGASLDANSFASICRAC
ncbi:MAG: triose-phosphate isomerase [Halomonadaceae bacterium]|nr:MAG: triose-phosphate isomerase [Halomonadaceae bacterium]